MKDGLFRWLAPLVGAVSFFLTVSLSTKTIAAPARWAAPVSGNWSIGSNWTTGSGPNAPGALAAINQPTTSNLNVTLNAPETVGALTLGNSFSSVTGYTLAGPGPFTFNNSGFGAMINVTDGSHVINSPVVLADNLTITGTGLFQINGNISQSGASHGITFAGSDLWLSGSNNFSGGTVVQAGDLLATTSASVVNGSNVVVGNAAAFFGPEIPTGNVRTQGFPYQPPTLTFYYPQVLGQVEIAGGVIEPGGIFAGQDEDVLIVTTSSFGFVPEFKLQGELGTPGVPEYGDNAINDAILEGFGQSNGITFILPISGGSGIDWFDNSSGSYSVYDGIPINSSQSVIYAYAPEPTTLALLSAGVIGLAAGPWRHQRQRTKL
jgi:hypothetical protein